LARSKQKEVQRMEDATLDKQHTSIELGISASIENGLEDSEIYEISQSIISAIMKVNGVKGGCGYSDIKVRTVVSNERKIEYDESWG
jgi:hypothetical protein